MIFKQKTLQKLIQIVKLKEKKKKKKKKKKKTKTMPHRGIEPA